MVRSSISSYTAVSGNIGFTGPIPVLGVVHTVFIKRVVLFSGAVKVRTVSRFTCR